MLKRPHLPFLALCFCALTSAEATATVFSNLKDRFAELYVIEKPSSIDVKRMTASIFIDAILFSTYCIEAIKDIKQSYINTKKKDKQAYIGKLIDHVWLLIISSIINGIIAYHGLRLNALNWIGWLLKWVILALVLGLIFCILHSYIHYELMFNEYHYVCVYSLIFQAILPYALYRCMIYFFPIQHTQHLILTEKSTL